MTLPDITELISQHDPRCLVFIHRSALTAARALGIYERGREYDEDDFIDIEREVKSSSRAEGTTDPDFTARANRVALRSGGFSQIFFQENPMKLFTTQSISAASMADLIAFFNANSDKPVKKFTDRKTAERRVLALSGPVEPTDEEISAMVQAKPAPKGKAAPKDHADLSEAQRRCWKDPAIREARCERSAVVVNKTEYKSVPVAFKELDLPSGQMTQFRARLKEAGKLTEYGFKWEILPLNY